MAYVQVLGSNIGAPGLDPDIVPVSPRTTSFKFTSSRGDGFDITRSQVPLIPAFSITDYKSQGQSLECAIVDLASAKTLQSVYVMLSRVKTLDGLAILRYFPESKLMDSKNKCKDVKSEFQRLAELASKTQVDLASYGI